MCMQFSMQVEYREFLYHMIIVDGLPFSFVEKEGLRVYESGATSFLDPFMINQIFTVTVDNVSSIDVIVKEFPKQLTKMETDLMNNNHIQVRCMAYIVNLIIQDNLKENYSFI
ncbi:hypothetical protein H5410_026736 [Solanum commersonii]|uniref:Uncharacterized protein n=1 Tax=Solanum commersonii TaxID=4109 RepID=A0A9J5Z1H8_SOLCO|nr:hypothetical protein H5410_026736 [Solanum commersonii]